VKRLLQSWCLVAPLPESEICARVRKGPRLYNEISEMRDPGWI
jgi:hypothetical protein